MTQIIKPGLSIQVLYDLLGVYIASNKLFVTNSLYKKVVSNNTNAIFVQTILPFYHKSKQFYCLRTMTYNRWLTILRQLCKYFKLPYTSTVRYHSSTYDMTLLILVSS
jgi:hypothetical protein